METLSVARLMRIDGLKPSGATICLNTLSPRGLPSRHGLRSHRGRSLARFRPLRTSRLMSLRMRSMDAPPRGVRYRHPMKSARTTIIRTSR